MMEQDPFTPVFSKLRVCRYSTLVCTKSFERTSPYGGQRYQLRESFEELRLAVVGPETLQCADEQYKI